MTKKDLKLLGAVFAHEITGGSLQSKSKEYLRLEKEGFVFLHKQTLHFKDGLPPMQVEGWNLTHKGHFEYCTSCKDEPGENEEPN